MNPTTKQRGFTLVEMAIVLAIIGLILGAVMIGKDVQRNAEYAKIKQKFIDQWVVAYNTAYQRAGVPVGDSQTAPQLMVNGASFAQPATPADGDTPAKPAIVSGGDMSKATAPAPICAGRAAPGMTTALTTLRDEMLRLGVRMPPGRAEGSEDRYVYLDSNGNPQEIQVCFQWNKPGTASGAGNVMVITGLTPDLARALDQMIDGKADAREGMFRMAGIDNGVGNVPGAEWEGNNNIGYGAAKPSATGAGTAQDEQQVMVLTAHYKMNQ